MLCPTASRSLTVVRVLLGGYQHCERGKRAEPTYQIGAFRKYLRASGDASAIDNSLLLGLTNWS